MSNFDADALERAAKFARQLESSRNSKTAIELSRREQALKNKKYETEQETARARQAEAQVSMERVKYEEQRKTEEHRMQMARQLEQERMQAKRQQMQFEDEMARKRNAELVRQQNAAAMEREHMRRQTEEQIQAERRRSDEHRAALERENIVARANAEAAGRIEEMRQNEDIYAKQIQLKGEQRVKQVKEAVQTFFSSLGSQMGGFLGDREKMGAAVLGVTAVAAGIYGMREGTRVARRVLEARLFKPQLVRETSRTAGHFGIRRMLMRRLGMAPPAETGISGVILDKSLDRRVTELAAATASTRKFGAPFRHALFYGPPGTGKTMLAKRLALSSGMDYALMTGGDVGPLGREAVTELHKLFDWSSTTRRGLLLFIDEADAFLSSRARQGMSEEQRNALNAVLARTGEASRDIMLVLATNRPEDLDSAVGDRVDEALHFELPGEQERVALLKKYFQEYVRDAGKDAPGVLFGLGRPSAARLSIEGDDFTDAYWEEVAGLTEGMSGRAISKLMLGVQGAAYGRGGAQVNRALFEQVLQDKLSELQAKSTGFSEARAVYVNKGLGRAEAVIEAEQGVGKQAGGSGVGGASRPSQAPVMGGMGAPAGARPVSRGGRGGRVAWVSGEEEEARVVEVPGDWEGFREGEQGRGGGGERQ